MLTKEEIESVQWLTYEMPNCYDLLDWIDSKKKQWQEEAWIAGYKKASGKVILDNSALVEDLFNDIKPKGKK